MDYLTQLLERNRQAAPREVPLPEARQGVLWVFPDAEASPVRSVSAALSAAPNEAMEAAFTETEQAAERLTRQMAGGNAARSADLTARIRQGADAPAGTDTFGSLSAALGAAPGASAPTMEEISRYFERDARRYG